MIGRSIPIHPDFLPAGYQGIRVIPKPEWITCPRVEEIWSVNGCMNRVKGDWINQWLHNGHWHFNTVTDLRAAYAAAGMTEPYTIVYLELWQWAYDRVQNTRIPLWCEASFPTQVEVPEQRTFVGHDIVAFSGRGAPECALLSCNNQAALFAGNPQCLTDLSPEDIVAIMQATDPDALGEPGPYKIYAVHRIP